MNKRILILSSIVIVEGALALSQVDSSRFTNAIPGVNNRATVDLLNTTSRTQFRTALSNAANEMNYDINFKEIYRKSYKLGSVEETRDYKWTKVNISIGLMQGINLTIFGDKNASLSIAPSGFVSDKEVRQYFDRFSNYLPKQLENN